MNSKIMAIVDENSKNKQFTRLVKQIMSKIYFIKFEFQN